MKEFLKKAKETETMEEFKALLSGKGLDIDEEKAEKFYARIHSGEELSDAELAGLIGGVGINLNIGNAVHTKRCPKCGALMQVAKNGSSSCISCGYKYSLGTIKF